MPAAPPSPAPTITPDAGPPEFDISSLAVTEGRVYVTMTQSDGVKTFPSVLFASRDQGKTWQQVNTIPAQVQSMSFATDDIGWAATPDSLLETSDGGATWSEARRFPPEARLIDIQLLTRSHGWIVAGFTIQRTMDGGRTWTTIASPCGPEARGHFDFFSPDHAWLVCAHQPSAGSQLKSVFFTRDGGDTWELVFRDPILTLRTPTTPGYGVPRVGYVSRVAAFDATTVIFKAHRAGTWITRDGWRSGTWLPEPTSLASETTSEWEFVSPEDGYVVLGGDVLVLTHDGGTTWCLALSTYEATHLTWSTELAC